MATVKELTTTTNDMPQYIEVDYLSRGIARKRFYSASLANIVSGTTGDRGTSGPLFDLGALDGEGIITGARVVLRYSGGGASTGAMVYVATGTNKPVATSTSITTVGSAVLRSVDGFIMTTSGGDADADRMTSQITSS